MVKNLLGKNDQTGQNFPNTEELLPTTTNLANREDGGFAQSTSPSPSAYIQTDPTIPKAARGKLSQAKDQVNFVGSEHWEAILEDITDLKIDLEAAETSERDDLKPQIWFGVNHASRSEIMSSIPDRPVCDVLISRWFRTMDMAPMVVHVPTFMKEYNQMFEYPNETPLMWIGLLFSILGLGSYFYAISGEELHTMPDHYSSMWEMSCHFRDRTAQCLVEVNYLRPRRYTVDTLCFYFALEKFQSRDSGFGAYVLSGTIVRVAMRLGYHRDASHYPSISPFDGEMRRRVWSMIFQLDLSTSAQVGLPRMIRDEETDTAEPKNLLDTDFDEGITELPHPRPSTFITPVACAIFMVRLLRQLGFIIDQVNSSAPSSYDKVMRLDHQLMDTHATLPAYLTVRSLSLSITDDADLILRRYALAVCFQKSRCILHRKYLIPGRSDPQFRYSRNAAVDAAMKLLDVQSVFHEATQPGRQLFSEKWRSSALINQDYVLAAMILCLDLAWSMKVNSPPDHEIQPESVWSTEKILHALRNSYDIWSTLSSVSTLASKATEALKVMLKDLESTGSIQPAPIPSVPNSNNLPALPLSAPAMQPTYNDPLHFGPSNDFDMNNQYFVGSTTDFLTGATNAETNFDWDLWDNQFRPASIVGEDLNSFTFQ